MPDCKDKLRDKLYDEYEDSLFRLVMYEAAGLEGRLLLEERDALKENAGFSPSEEAVRKFEKRIKTIRQKGAAVSKKRVFSRAAHRVAMAALLITLFFSIAMMSVSALRIRVLNFLISVEERYTSFQLTENDEGGGGKLSVDWDNEYAPSDIPDGFEISNVTSLETMKRIQYENADGRMVMYSMFSSNTNVAVDSENASRIEKIDINEKPGTLIVKGAMASVVWEMDGRLFVIQGEIDPEEAVGMAKSVRPVE